MTQLGITPYGQQLAREQQATETAQTAQSARAAATANAYTLSPPTPTNSPTATPLPSNTPVALSTPTPLPTATSQPTATSRPQATATPRPRPTSTPTPCPGVNCNPWGYNFNCCNYIYNPPGNLCDYFACIPSFWNNTNGYVEECQDGMYSHSGGVKGSCSHHGGNWRPLLQQ